MLVTTASANSPSTSSITAAARITLLARCSSSPLDASTWAVIPTLVATIATPTNTDSIVDFPNASRISQPEKKGTMTPSIATARAVPPT